MLPTQERLREVLDYNQNTGVFTWKTSTSNRVKTGHRAGCVSDRGYVIIGVDADEYRAHRLAWLYVYGSAPDRIDHKNRNRQDNRICNLRPATSSQSNMNRPARRNGLKGVDFFKARQKWRARVHKEGKATHLGYFDTEQEAHSVYWDAAKEVHGEFACAA